MKTPTRKLRLAIRSCLRPGLSLVALLLIGGVVSAQCRNGRCYQWQGTYGGYGTTAGSYQAQIQDRIWRDGTGDVIAKHPTIQKALKFINDDRARHGRQPLKLNPVMCLQAQRHSEQMTWRGQYHSSLPYMECIFCGPRTARHCVNGWIYSGPHHGIMLSGTECGIGYSDARTGAWTLVVR